MIKNSNMFKGAMLFTAALVVALQVHAADSAMTLSTSSVGAESQAKLSVEPIAASSRSEALKTYSAFYSVPKKDMSFFELGGYRQGETVKSNGYNENYVYEKQTQNLTNQVFYFNHSRGLTDDVALDFSFDYFMRDASAQSRTTGVNQVSLGARSTFEFLSMNWIYGAHVIYIPNGEVRDSNIKSAAQAEIGFEDNVDIAKWGLQIVPTTRQAMLNKEQMYLQGFFEVPVINALNLGIQGGADMLHLANNEQENYAQFYGQYMIDKVSSVKLFMRERSASLGSNSVTDTEAGLGVTKVF